jgi:putative tricarboxylic transport membrane protein
VTCLGNEQKGLTRDLTDREALTLARNPLCCIVALILLALTMAATARAQPAYPHLRIVVPSAPGGGFDVTARAMQPALQAASIVRSSSVENIPGAGGTIGLARFASAELGNPDVVLVSGLTMLGAIVSYRSVLTFADVTPIARLIGDYEVVFVPVTSPFRSLPDLIAAFQKQPESVSWAGGAVGGTEHMLVLLMADAVRVNPKLVNFIAFAGAGESNPAVLGGQVSVGLGPLSTVAALIEAGAVRVLGISSAERIPSLDAPTLREQGVDVEFENWRSLFAPPGVSDADRRRLEAAVEEMAQSTAWRDTLSRYRWNDRILTGPAFVRFLEAEEARVRAVFRKLGAGLSEGSAPLGAYPTVVIAGLVSMLLAFAIAALRSQRLVIEAAGSGWKAIILVATGIIVDLALVEYLGFILASSGLFWLTARAFDARHPLRDGAVAVAVSFTAYIVFARLLGLSLPPGVLPDFL